MAAVAKYSPVPTFRALLGIAPSPRPEPQSDAGKDLLDKADEVCRQWVEQAEILSASIGLAITGDDGAEVPYVSSALKPAFYVKVRYKHVGKMKSVPYPFDD